MGKITNFKDIYPSATSFFSEWAERGKDAGMEKGHTDSVNFMFDRLSPKFKNPFSALDVGCGNGWVVRKFKKTEMCKVAMGVDGADKMIQKAQGVDSSNQYFCADILQWSPFQKFNIIHSMEVLYYLEDPSKLVNSIYSEWLDKAGCFIFGIDHYTENPPSINWPVECGVNMNTQPINYWLILMKEAGFKNIQHWQTGEKDEWMGTLVILGEK